jgi:LysR family glycine cleavage system transcriptional activator
LNVTQAAIAQHVRGLEAELGVALAKRTGRTVALTPEGARLAQNLSSGFETIAEALGDFRARQQDRPVQMAATVFIAQSLVLPRLLEFWAKHPDIEVSIQPTSGAVDLIAGCRL